MTLGVCLLMNLCEPCTCSLPLLVMLIPEGDEEHVREGAQISGRIARSNEWVGMICIAFPSHRAEGMAGGGASFWKRVVRNSIPAAGGGGAVGSHT